MSASELKTKKLGLARRLLQPRFSIGALLVILTLLCIVFFQYARLEQIRHGIATIEGSRGQVGYFESDGEWGELETWLRKRMPKCYFDEVQAVFVNSKEEDLNLAFLSQLGSIEDLNIAYQPVSDRELASLKKLTSLKRLFLQNTKLTDEGLSQLSGLNSLTSLYLSSTGLNDDGVKHLSKFQSLRELSLANTSVSDLGLKHLSELKMLKRLDLKNTKVTLEGIETLQAALPNCLINF